jgi:hypothetical protein
MRQNRLLKTLAIALLYPSIGALFGCSHTPVTEVDRQFGTMSKVAFMEQRAPINAARISTTPHATDGGAMKSAVDRYHKSFETLPTPINIFNIGVGTPTMNAPQR